jgi:hypothetical protein
MPRGAMKKAVLSKPKRAAAKSGRSATTVDDLPVSVSLLARMKGKVYLRLRVLDPHYTAGDIAALLNAGNESWEGGEGARYHRVKKHGRVIAEIEYADEDVQWERYQADERQRTLQNGE